MSVKIGSVGSDWQDGYSQGGVNSRRELLELEGTFKILPLIYLSNQVTEAGAEGLPSLISFVKN